MKTLQEMSIEELNKELESRQTDAFYSECLSPKTPEDKAHNKGLVDSIDEVRAEIEKR
jgi:hypothetical protein